MKKYAFYLLLFTFIGNLCIAQNKDEREITTMLAAQVVQWNKGNVDDIGKAIAFCSSAPPVPATATRPH